MYGVDPHALSRSPFGVVGKSSGPQQSDDMAAINRYRCSDRESSIGWQWQTTFVALVVGFFGFRSALMHSLCNKRVFNHLACDYRHWVRPVNISVIGSLACGQPLGVTYLMSKAIYSDRYHPWTHPGLHLLLVTINWSSALRMIKKYI